MKKIPIALLLSLCATPISAWDLDNLLNSFSFRWYAPRGYTMTRQQARSYLSSIAQNVEREFKHSRYDAELRDLRYRIVNDCMANQTTYSNTDAGTRYSKEKLDMLLRSAIIEYIERRTYNYTYSKTGSHDTARRIAESMRNNAMVEIERNGLRRLGALGRLVGRDLDKAIDVQQRPAYRPQAPAPRPSYSPQRPTQPELDNVYPSDECCICQSVSFNTPSGSAQRVFLIPCGHDLCKDCARRWLVNNPQNKAQTCPQCRRHVNMDKTFRQIK